MIQPINIDVSAFAQIFAIPEQDIRQFTSNIISELAAEFVQYWDNAANELKSSRQEYKNSIYVEQIDDFNYIVGLNGFLSNAIEQGIEGFDQKQWFERSDKVKYNKDGDWYLTIPFRFGTSNAVGESAIFSNILPSQVYKKAKQLGADEALSKTDLPKEFQTATTRMSVITKSKMFEEYQRKHSIYEGIQRKLDEKGRGQYISFRRVGENSDPNSWIHPGFDSRNLAEKALSNMDIPSTVDAIVNKYIDELV